MVYFGILTWWENLVIALSRLYMEEYLQRLYSMRWGWMMILVHYAKLSRRRWITYFSNAHIVLIFGSDVA